MKTTLEIPDIPKTLQARVKSKGQREGLHIPTVTELYQAWVDDNVFLPPPPPPPLSPEEHKRRAEKWIAGMDQFVRELACCPAADPRTLSEILMEGRNRLEPNSPSLYPAKGDDKTLVEGRG